MENTEQSKTEETERSQGTLYERLEKAGNYARDGFFAGAAGSAAVELANDYVNGGTYIDPDLAAATLAGGVIGNLALGFYGITKKGIGAIFGTEVKPEEERGYMERVGTHASDGFILGGLAGSLASAAIGSRDYFIDALEGSSASDTIAELDDYLTNVAFLDSDMAVVAAAGAVAGAVAGTALMGTYGVVKEGISNLVHKLPEDSPKKIKYSALGGLLGGLLGSTAAVALNDYLTGDPVTGDGELEVAALTGAVGGAALLGAYSVIKEGMSSAILNEPKPVQTYNSEPADKNTEIPDTDETACGTAEEKPAEHQA